MKRLSGHGDSSPCSGFPSSNCSYVRTYASGFRLCRFGSFVRIGGQITRHVGRGEVADGTKSETSNEPIVAVEIVLERVGGKHENVRLLG